MIRAAAAAMALAALATVPAACGEDEEAETTPASVVPASSLVYADAQLRPEGEERTAVEAPLAALLGTEDPGGMIVDELDRMAAEDGSEITYEADIEPWLGERGAIFFTSVVPTETTAEESFAEKGLEGAIVVESTDPDAAQAFVDKANAEEELEGSTLGTVGDHVVFGSDIGFEEVVDTEAGGESLAGDDRYAAAVGEHSGATATLFADVPAIVDAAGEAGEISVPEREALDTAFAGLADEPFVAAIDAETTGFGVDVSYGATDVPLLSAAPESALIRELPEDSWLAAGFTDAGETIGSLLSGAKDFGVDADEIDSNAERFRRELGLELEELYEPLGDGAVFANGEGIFGTGGGVVFETGDPAAAKKLIAGLERAAKRGGEEVRRLSGRDGEAGFSIEIQNTPGSVNFVAGEDRIVIAYGEAATVAALDPDGGDGSLGESEAFTEAVSKLGEDYDVSGFLDFAPIAGLLDLAAATDPSLQEALPYLEALDYVITGSSADGDRERQRLFLGISGITEEPTT